jgi:hypothetical protein
MKLHIHIWKTHKRVHDGRDGVNAKICRCGLVRERQWIGALFGHWSKWKINAAALADSGEERIVETGGLE